MRKCDIRSIDQAFVYISDCNLTTVSRMSGIKSRPTGEFKRQKDIAQSMVHWIADHNVDCEDSRAFDVINNFNGSVELWADQYDVLKKVCEKATLKNFSQQVCR